MQPNSPPLRACSKDLRLISIQTKITWQSCDHLSLFEFCTTHDSVFFSSSSFHHHYLPIAFTHRTEEETTVMVLLTNREKLTLHDQTRAPQEVFDTVVKKHKSFKKFHRLCADLGVDTQVFDLPEQREWVRLADERHGLMMDMLHFTPGRQSATVKKYGLRLQHEDDEEMVLRCRGLYWLCCQFIAQVDSTSTAQQMLDSTILCNSKSSMTPSDGGGQPYDYNKGTAIQKNTKTYKAWEKEENNVLVLQLECVYELASAYGINTVSLMLGGRGTGAKSGRGGSHLKCATQAHTALSPAAQQMIVMPDQAYW